MHNKTFLVMIISTVILLAIGFLPNYWSLPPSVVEVNYYNALKVATAKCGSTIQLFGIFMQRGITSYSFTRGNCGTGSGYEEVDVDYNNTTHSVGDLHIQKQPPLDFGRMPNDSNHPILLVDWKISSEKAFEIIYKNGGPRNLDNAEDKLASLQLVQGESFLAWKDTQITHGLYWRYTQITNGLYFEIVLDAANGQVIRRRKFTVTL